MNIQSELWTLGKSDFVKGLFLAILVAVLGAISNGLSGPTGLEFLQIGWPTIAHAAILAFVSYLGKNLATASNGKIFGRI